VPHRAREIPCLAAALCAAVVAALPGCIAPVKPEKPPEPLIFPAPPSWQLGNPAPAPVDPAEAARQMWNDPVFRRQFLAGYGTSSEVEPRLTPEEVELLDKVRPMMADNLPGAEAMLASRITGNSSAALDLTLGSIQFQQDKLPEALENYQKAVSKLPSFRRAWRNLGLIYARTGKYDEAIQSFTKMIELGGGDGLAYGLLGAAHFAKQDFQPAEAAYRNALLLQPENTEWRLGLTRCVFKQGKYEDAVALLDALIQRFPDKADFWLLQAQTYIGLKQPLRAAENLEMVDRLGKSTPDSLATLGDIYRDENLIDLAAGAYRRALDADPKQPLAKPLRSAELLASRGAVAQARQLTTHVRATRQDLAEEDRRRLLKLEARLGMAEGGGADEAVVVLEEIVKLDPLDGEALMLLGRHYTKANQPDRAILYYERAASIEAFEAQAKVAHAQVLVSLGRHGDAVPLLRRAQELKPRESVARYLEQVERIARARR
jgi:tetratricopeptide (TPR) repeat protein